MDNCQKKIIGILGGMGPEATSLFFQKIISYTPAEKDQDHFKVIIYNDPEIPDRSKSILENTESPIKKARVGLKFLETSNVDFILIPCVTIHYYFDELENSINIPILNIIDETAKYIKKEFSGLKKIGILATKGTYEGKIFQKVFHKKNLIPVIPDINGQESLMEAIYGKKGIKAGHCGGYPKKLILKVAEDLIRNGAEVIVGGCTEIPIAIGEQDFNVPFVDSLTVLAHAAIAKAGLPPK